MTDRLPALLDLLDSADVRDRIRMMIEDLGGVSDTDAEAIVEHTDARLHGIAESLRDVCFDDDTSEAHNMLPWIWLELRFEWMRYNLQMQYQTILLGTANPALMARGAALSYLLEAVELHLDAESAFLVQKIAADPAGAARGAIERTDRLFSLMASASAGGRDAVESLLVAQDQIARHTDSQPVRQEMSKAISAVIEKVGGALRVSVVDFAHAFEGVLIRQLGQAPVRVALSQESPDYNLTIPSAVANALLKASAEWMDAIAHSSLHQSAQARMDAGLPAHVTLRVSLKRTGDRVELTLADDADGTVDYHPNWRAWPIRDLKLQLSQIPGTGSTMTFRCDVASVTEYLMLRVGLNELDAVVGIPMRLVGHIERRDQSAIALQGERLISRQHGGTLRLIDLGDSLFHAPIAPDEATYVHVRPDGDEGEVLALRVRGVEGVCRGSLKSMPALLEDAPLRGFVQADRRIVGIVDFDRLLERDDDAQRWTLMVAAA